jgi:hypothetical protein
MAKWHPQTIETESEACARMFQEGRAKHGDRYYAAVEDAYAYLRFNGAISNSLRPSAEIERVVQALVMHRLDNAPDVPR